MSEDNKIEMPGAALIALAKGSKIDAIKALRKSHRLGLKEAKDEVEQYIDAHPELQRKMGEANAAQGKAFLRTVVVIALLAALVYFGMDHFG